MVNGGINITKTENIISGENLSTRQLNFEIKKAVSQDKKKLLLENPEKMDSIAVGLSKDTEVTLKGDVGDFVGALNNGARIEIRGNTGRYVGNNMTSGEILVRGSAEDGVGFGIYEGTIIIYGDAGDAVGQLNKGGTIIIVGDMGNLAGLYMLSGDIVVTGDAGLDTGDWMIGGNIYVGGNFKPGTNALINELSFADKQKLAELFKKYSIKADIGNFRKVEHQELRPFYGENDEEVDGEDL